MKRIDGMTWLFLCCCGFISTIQLFLVSAAYLTFPTLLNNSMTSTSYEILVEINMALMNYDYDWMKNNFILCVETMTDLNCFPIDRTTYVLHVHSHDENAIEFQSEMPIDTVSFLLFVRDSQHGIYSVMDKDGYDLVEEYRWHFKMATVLSCAEYELQRYISPLILNMSIASAILFSVKDSKIEYTTAITKSTCQWLLSHSPKQITLVTADGDRDLCTVVTGLRKACYSYGDLNYPNSLINWPPISIGVSWNIMIVVIDCKENAILHDARKFLEILVNRVKEILVVVSVFSSQLSLNMMPQSIRPCFHIVYGNDSKDSVDCESTICTIIISDLKKCTARNQLLVIEENSASAFNANPTATDRDKRNDVDAAKSMVASHNGSHYELEFLVPNSIFEMELKSIYVSFIADYGVNIAHLRHIYLIEESKVLIPIWAKEPNFPSDIEFLKRSDSGFHRAGKSSVTALEFLSCFIDESPPLYNPLKHVLMQCGDPTDGANQTLNSIESVIRLKGFSVVMVPPYSPSIFHAAQVLLGWYYYTEYYYTACNKLFVANRSVNEDVVQLLTDWKNTKWIEHVRRVILPSVSQTDYEWTLGLIEMLKKYSFYTRHQCQQKKLHWQSSTPNIQPSSILYSLWSEISDVPLYDISIYLEEDITALLAQRNLAVPESKIGGDSVEQGSIPYSNGSPMSNHLIHVDEMIAVGTLELRIAMFRNRQACDSFRSFAYQQFGLADGSSQYPATSPNAPLNVTILLRPKTRWLHNIPEIGRLLLLMGLLGKYDSYGQSPYLRIVSFEFLSLADQIAILHSTDILISPHGAGLQNLIYIQEHSAVIEIMTSPWYEPGYQATAMMCGIHYSTIAHSQARLDASRDCEFPQSCLETDLLVSRRKLDCYGMRQCGSTVDLHALEISTWQASQSVRLIKRNIAQFRKGESGAVSRNVYQKGYDHPLQQH